MCWYAMPRLNEAQRYQAVGMIRAGVSQNEVSRRFGMHRNTTSALWRRYQQSGNTRDRRRSGRPRVTSLCQDTYIRVTHLRNRLQTAALTARSIPDLRNISPRTVRNRLRERNIRPWRPAIRPVLQRRHRVARLAWCRAHLRFTRQDWAHILFSDESRFHLDSSDGCSSVYRQVGERYQDNCVVERHLFGGGSIMVWGRITGNARTPLVVINGNLTGARFCDEILHAHVVLFVRQHVVALQHDNARPHVARVVTDFLTQQNVHVLPWPVVSPDLSPIEHAWDEMERRLRQLPNQPVTLAELSRALVRIWNGIPQAFFTNVVGSMRRRCNACITANGGHTRYDFVTWCLRHFWFVEPRWWNGSSFRTFESLELRWNVYCYKSEIYYYCLLRCYYFV